MLTRNCLEFRSAAERKAALFLRGNRPLVSRLPPPRSIMERRKPTKPARKRDREASPWGPLGWGTALVLLVAIVYLPTLGNGFIWDDDDYVENNTNLTSVSGLRDIWCVLGATPQYYPLAHTTFWIEHRLWGVDCARLSRGEPRAARRLRGAGVAAVGAVGRAGGVVRGAIFAVHPVAVESVAWVTERKNVLSCALALGSLLAYLRFSPPENAGDNANQNAATRRAAAQVAVLCAGARALRGGAA